MNEAIATAITELESSWLVPDDIPKAPTASSFWIGLNDRNTENTWVWDAMPTPGAWTNWGP